MTPAAAVLPAAAQVQQCLALVEQLVDCQRREQDAIFKRQTEKLAEICAEIDGLVPRVHKTLQRLQPIFDAPPDPAAAKLVATLRERLVTLQELTLQNHLLLENCLKFLQEMFEQVFGVEQRPALYDAMGMLPVRYARSGSLLNTRG